jgi:hypothetical protein
MDTQSILYSRNTPRYPGWAGVCSSFDPDTDPIEVHTVEHSPATADDLVIVTADTLPDEVAAILALTPHVDETADWATREAEAAAVSAAGADGLAASWGFFVEKRIQYEPDGDVLWAA